MLLAVFARSNSISAIDWFVSTIIFGKNLTKRMFTKFVIGYGAMNRVSHGAPAL